MTKIVYFRKVTKNNEVNHFEMQSNRFSPIEESYLMIALLLKKMESLKTTRKKQLKYLITTI